MKTKYSVAIAANVAAAFAFPYAASVFVGAAGIFAMCLWAQVVSEGIR